VKFSEIVKQTVTLLQGSGRVSYRALKREFDLDDEILEDLKEELVGVLEVAVDKDGEMLIWARDAESTSQPLRPPDARYVTTPTNESHTPDAERRQITVMFCDLVGSTALSEKLDPEDLRELMAAYQKAAGVVIERHEGHVAQYLGDGLMVYFGWPAAHEEDAAQAVRASLELVEAVKDVRSPEPLRVRIGIATGPVVVGETGRGDAAVPKAAVGETPNVAARLQGLAGPGEIVIGPTTQRLAGGAFDYYDLGRQELKGISDPLRAWRVVRESTVEGRFEARTMGRFTTLVGRESEIAMLLERWTEAKDGEGQVVLLAGDPGIGKSRITQALRERLANQPHTRLRYQCSPYYTNTAFYPVVDQLERAAGFARDDPPESRLDKLEALLTQGTENVTDVAPLFASLLSLPLERYAPLNMSPQRQKEKTVEAMVEQTAGLARRNPVLMIFEDVHWIDPTSLGVIGTMVDRLQGSAVLLMITFRPDFKSPWSGYNHVTLHSLNRLSRRQGIQMVANVTGGKALPEDVLDQIISRTDGVPLFVEELTKTILEAGLFEGEHSGGVREAIAMIPATLQDSLMARLDRLGRGKEIAQIGACIGREFNYPLIAAVVPEGYSGLDDALSQLIDAELMYRRGNPPDATYSFKHALVQDTAYQSLLKSRRRSFHGRIANALQEQFGDIVEAEPELLAHHYTEARLGELAIPYWQRAGERAVQRSANVEAIGHFTKALDVLETVPESPERNEQELRVQVALAVPLAATTGFASAGMEQVYTRARELCEQVGETSQLFPVLYGLWDFYLVRAEYKAAHKEAQQLLTSVQRAKDSGVILEAYRATGATLYYLGDFVSAREHIEAAMALYDPQKHRAHVALYRQEPGVACLSYDAWTLWCLGYPDQALEKMQQANILARESLHPFSLAWALNFAGRLYEFRREGQEAQERAEAVIALASEKGFAYWLAWGTVMQGWALTAQGQSEKGIAQLRKGIAAIRATGTKIARSQDLGLLAGAQCLLGQADDGLATVAEALAFVEQNEECYYEAELYRLKGILTLQSQATGRTSKTEEEVEACFQKAIEIARRQCARSWELRAITSLARLWRQQGKQTEAHQLLSEIYNWFTEGFDTTDLQEAKALLEELA
jgi:class 3 adenylate cyclase/predicted ATPase